MASEQRLPFRVLDSALGRMKTALDAGTDVARTALGRTTGSVSDETADQAHAFVPDGPAPSATATASAALATALNERASAALAAQSGDQPGEAASSITDGLAIDSDDGRVAPEAELGPKPQVGH